MAVLDNSGYIVLDAVLTDLGRKKMAQGNGSLPVRSYSFGDNEINYQQWDTNSPEASIAKVLLTPVHEASTNEDQQFFSLIGGLDKTLSFLPILQKNTNSNLLYGLPATSTGSYQVLSNINASNDAGLFYHAQIGPDTNTNTGIIDGTLARYAIQKLIHIDQGINSLVKGAKGSKIEPVLSEDQFFIKIDSKFGTIVSPKGNITNNLESVSTYDIATYSFSKQNDQDYFGPQPGASFTDINGPTGEQFQFSILASTYLLSNYVSAFATYGSIYATVGSVNYWKIESSVEVHGNTFGSYLNIPITYVVAI